MRTQTGCSRTFFGAEGHSSKAATEAASTTKAPAAKCGVRLTRATRFEAARSGRAHSGHTNSAESSTRTKVPACATGQ